MEFKVSKYLEDTPRTCYFHFYWIRQIDKCPNIREKGRKLRYKYVFITDITTLHSNNIFQKTIKNLKTNSIKRSPQKHLILDIATPNKLSFTLSETAPTLTEHTVLPTPRSLCSDNIILTQHLSP